VDSRKHRRTADNRNGYEIVKELTSELMRIKEKIAYLVDNHFGAWFEKRKEVERELSDSQDMFCVCGRLATGIHEMNCQRFRNKVNSETVKRLVHLLPKA